MVARACRLIDAAETPPSLAELAAAASLSPHHFHRQFKAATGVTPKAFAAARRMGRVQAGLAAGAGVTAAIFEAGFNASSRFYEAADAMLGMTPTAYRAGGRGQTIRSTIRPCTLGLVLIAATARGLCAIRFGDGEAALADELRRLFPQALIEPADTALASWAEAVVGLIEAPARGLDLPLDIQGTAFQRRVWEALKAIPPGTTTSYAELAARIGAPKSVRAVANACGANPVAVAVPCHRVLQRDGGLGGYRWGKARKEALLAREAAP